MNYETVYGQDVLKAGKKEFAKFILSEIPKKEIWEAKKNGEVVEFQHNGEQVRFKANADRGFTIVSVEQFCEGLSYIYL